MTDINWAVLILEATWFLRNTEDVNGLYQIRVGYKGCLLPVACCLMPAGEVLRDSSHLCNRHTAHNTQLFSKLEIRNRNPEIYPETMKM
jgi:hypothetical protein